MKILNGSELAGYIKQKHAGRARELKSKGINPKLAIVQVKDDPVINTYVRLKQSYGADVGVEVEIHTLEQAEAPKLIKKLNSDNSVHGIIVQLPLENPAQTEEIVNMVAPQKDVDALGKNAKFEPATPMAILWLLGGHGIEMAGRHVLLIGRGKLVGAPLAKILKELGVEFEVVGREATDLAAHTKKADVIITATGSPAILYSDMIKRGAVVIDAGVASEEGKTVGDLAEEVYQRDDLVVTPKKGGVGPLTVCALFENVIRAASNVSR